MLLSQEYPLSYMKSTEVHTSVKSKRKATNKMDNSELLFKLSWSFRSSFDWEAGKSAATVKKGDGRTQLHQDFQVSLYFLALFMTCWHVKWNLNFEVSLHSPKMEKKVTLMLNEKDERTTEIISMHLVSSCVRGNVR